MSNDRELLEAAAKAAGYWSHEFNCPDNLPRPDWNPLRDDGDALRLAVKLDIAPVWGSNRDTVRVDYPARFTIPLYESVRDGDRYAATRRAIVRAAAEIGMQA